MSEFYQRFVIGDVAAVKAMFLEVIDKAEARGLVAVSNFVKVILVEMEDELTALSLRTVQVADEAIRTAIHHTAKRAPQTHPGGLLDHVKSEPIITDAGIVGIARKDGPGGLDELPYWRAQEYGLDEGFVGRILFGFFYDFGGTNPTTPQPGIDTQPSFEFDSTGGAGVIRHPIEARKFLQTGTDAAAAFWRREQRRIVERAVRRLSGVSGAIGR